MMPQKIILVTDIGDNVDDALALGLICCMPTLTLMGVTTVFGDVQERTRAARTVLTHAGSRFRSIPVAAGCSSVLASRPKSLQETELKNKTHQQSLAFLSESELQPSDPRHALDFLIETLMAGDGDIIVITIGALTNVASALIKEPLIAAKIPKIVIMASEHDIPMVEWNIGCDPESAAIVFGSGVPLDVISWTIGRKVQFNYHDIERLGAIGSPLANHLTDSISLWQAGVPKQMPALYDPLTAIAIVRPDLFEWRQGQVTVDISGHDTYGRTYFVPIASGPHRVAFEVDRDRAVDVYLNNLAGQD